LPGESRGVIPTPGKLHPNGRPEWSKPTPFSLAMGHNIQMTSVQLLRGFALFANGGYLVEPTLVRKIVKAHADGSEEVLVDHTSEERVKQFPRVLSPEVVDTVLKALKYVTKPGGSGRRADVWGYTEAGKTGTPEKIVDGTYCKQKTAPTFVGFTPVEDPAFVLVITIDEPECRYIPGVGKNHNAGIAAAPVFREIAHRALAYLGITPDDPYGYPVGDPRYDPEKAYWVPETRKLKELYEEWNK